MATTTLIIVIIVLSGNLIILLLPIGKTKKAALCTVIAAVFSATALLHNAAADTVSMDIQMRITKAPTQEAKQFLMTRFKVTETALNHKAENGLKTPLEIFGGILIVLVLYLTLVLVVGSRNCNDKEAGEAHQAALVLTAGAMAYILSLYYGLQLGIIAWVKNNKAVSKPTLSQAE